VYHHHITLFLELVDALVEPSLVLDQLDVLLLSISVMISEGGGQQQNRNNNSVNYCHYFVKLIFDVRRFSQEKYYISEYFYSEYTSCYH